jgi:electron transfer flavoprotein alpha subunit
MSAPVLVHLATAPESGAARKSAAEVATAGRRLADARGVPLLGVVAGPLSEEGRAVIARHGVERILHVSGAPFARYLLESHAAAVEAALRKTGASVLVLSASVAGRELGATVAARTNRGLAADVIEVRAEGTGLRAIKPKYAGKAVAEVIVEGEAVVSIRPNTVPPVESPREGAVEALAVEVPAPRVRWIESVAPQEKQRELTESDAIVSGGRGLGGPEHWHLVVELAEALGAAHGASRAVVDAGWRPHSEQVGQTGKTVSPKLYVACGISGAIQHLAGMSSSKVIVAINKDADAPIFKVADYGIVGDCREVLPMLAKAARDFLAR